MIYLIINIIVRIFSNSYLNVYQKLLTNRGEKSSVINFYTYLGLSVICLAVCPTPIYNQDILLNIFIMGFLGALGNYFIIKALSCGELSTLAPINSYKPIIALFLGMYFLKEIPNLIEVFGILLIISGTFLLGDKKLFYNKAVLYRFLALIFSGTEALFIKKIILLSDITSAFFYWAIVSFIFTIIFVVISKNSIKLQKQNLHLQLVLIILVALMQYSTNYVFSKMNVAYALSLFQLSTIISVFLGVNVFNEKGLLKKLVAAIIMLFGAVIIIL